MRGAPRPSAERDHIYWFGSRGCIFTSPRFRTGETTRQAAVLLLAAGGAVEVATSGRVMRHDAIGVAPMCTRRLQASDGLISVNVHVDHPGFRAFSAISGLAALDRGAFSGFDGQLSRARDGLLSVEEAARLFDDLVRTAAEQLPPAQPCDPRVDLVRAVTRRSPSCTLDDLADALNVSYTTASHLFSRTMGLSLRSYQLWIKAIRAAARMAVGARLTDIAHEVGFVDSAHLSRTWRRTYGFAPSYVTDGTRVRVLR